MTALNNKIDFAVVISAKDANPNGDPLNGNCPRTNFAGIGEMSDVCIKRKLRNRLQDMGQPIFVQSLDRRTDSFLSLKDRSDCCDAFKKALSEKNKDDAERIACKEWIDVRSFGQVFAYKGKKGSKKGKKAPTSDTESEDGDEVGVSI